MIFVHVLFAVFGVVCFLSGMLHEHRATKLKQCEPIKDRAAYEECLKND